MLDVPHEAGLHVTLAELYNTFRALVVFKMFSDEIISGWNFFDQISKA